MSLVSNATNINKHRAKRLIAIFAMVFCVAGLVIWLTLTSGQTLIAQSKQLTDYRIPELREISRLQMTMSARASQLYLYYANFDSDMWQQQDQKYIEQTVRQLEMLRHLNLTRVEGKKFVALVDEFSTSAIRFDEEMKKNDERDWDLLRSHLAQAQQVTDQISALVGMWSDDINQSAQTSGMLALNQVNHLTQLQLGFSLTVMLISAFVLITLYARLKDQDELFRMAYFDSLTGLPNRQRLEDDLAALLSADSNGRGALFVVQIDRIKVIASTYGHAISDQLIIQIVRGIEQMARVSKGRLYRVNTDSLAVICQKSCELQTALAMAKALASICDSSFVLGERTLTTKLSIGVALFSEQRELATSIIRNAVAALTHQKRNSNIHFFEDHMTAESELWLSTESALRAALANNEFELHYQPKVCAKTQATVSSEALIRWRRDGKLISPAQFIPVAEESGLIVPIGNWVLLEACRQWQSWHEAHLPQLPIAVNISAQQFLDPTFLMHVDDTLKRYEIPSAMIELEITEAVATYDPDIAVIMMGKLKALGVTLAIDDFGTGYSSLSYLKRFPVDTLKIDIAFVRNIHTSSDDHAIASMILALGKQLDLKVVAEGVELKAQQELLTTMGCDILQGYLFSRPIPAAEFAAGNLVPVV